MHFLHCNLRLLAMLLPFSSTWLATWLVPHTLPILLWFAPTLACMLHSTWLVSHTLPVLLWFAPTLNCPLYSLYIVLLNATLMVGCMFAFVSHCVMSVM